jgi:nicotinamide-nucleotide amidase
MGTAPGMYYYQGGKHLVSFPGVPYEMKHLFLDRFVPIIQPFIGKEKLIQRTILTVGMGETSIAEKISEIESNMADGLTLAYLPDIGKVRLRISGIGEDGQLLQEKVDEVSDSIIQVLGEAVYGEGDMTLSQALQELMHRKKMTLGLAESCTGGNISKHITAIPGSSRFYKGGIVSYANEIKESVLGVRRESIESFGAVSEVVAREMADGALRVMDVDIAASVTGIAGPDGGSETKPVGTFWVGLAIKGGETQAYKINFNRDRERNIEYVTVYVLNRIRLYVNDN